LRLSCSILAQSGIRFRAKREKLKMSPGRVPLVCTISTRQRLGVELLKQRRFRFAFAMRIQGGTLVLTIQKPKTGFESRWREYPHSLPRSGSLTILKSTFSIRGINSSTLGRETSWAHQLEPGLAELVSPNRRWTVLGPGCLGTDLIEQVFQSKNLDAMKFTTQHDLD